MNDFLPISKKDMHRRGIDQLDFICVTGDSYVDHPTFGTAIISRVMEAEGFSVGIIAQPGWKNPNDMMRLGAPKYAFFVNSGNTIPWSRTIRLPNENAVTTLILPAENPDGDPIGR